MTIYMYALSILNIHVLPKYITRQIPDIVINLHVDGGIYADMESVVSGI